MTDKPNPDLSERRQDELVNSVWADVQAGPVKESLFLSILFPLGIIWIVGSIVAAFFPLFTELTLEYALFAMTTMALSPLVGMVVFVIGWLRKHRYTLGKKVEKTGLVIIGVTFLNIVSLIWLMPAVDRLSSQ